MCLGAGGSEGKDARTEARCGQKVRTYPASEFLCAALAPLGCVISKLSKLLNQGDALSAPCFWPAPSRGAPRPGGMPRKA